jgi:predicted acetyltransferase
MLQRMLLKRMFANQLKSIPEEQQEKLFSALERNPTLFQNIAREIQEKTKNGMEQNSAAMEVMQKYQEELVKAFNG